MPKHLLTNLIMYIQLILLYICLIIQLKEKLDFINYLKINTFIILLK